MVKNTKLKALFFLFIPLFFACNKEKISVSLIGIFDWEYTNYYDRTINEDTIGKTYSIEFINEKVIFYENENELFKGKVIEYSHSEYCRSNTSGCENTQEFTILIENKFTEIKKRTFMFTIFSKSNIGVPTTYLYYSWNFPFEKDHYSSNLEYPYFSSYNIFKKR